jgi:hypothetical protein
MPMDVYTAGEQFEGWILICIFATPFVLGYGLLAYIAIKAIRAKGCR